MCCNSINVNENACITDSAVCMNIFWFIEDVDVLHANTFYRLQTTSF